MKKLKEELLPFGMRIHKRNHLISEGAPMSELTRRVLMNLISSAKKWKDGAGNDDALYNASNIKAAEHNKFSNHTSIMDNGEHYNADQTKVAQNGIREANGEMNTKTGKYASGSKINLSRVAGSFKDNLKKAEEHPDDPITMARKLGNKVLGAFRKRKAGK
tara:strand:- start:20 stop:502 length:483 start_codon:yes stop_codon:yes gene_type:complete